MVNSDVIFLSQKILFRLLTFLLASLIIILSLAILKIFLYSNLIFIFLYSIVSRISQQLPLTAKIFYLLTLNNPSVETNLVKKKFVTLDDF